MKKRLALVVLMLLLASTLFAKVDFVLNLKPYYLQDTAPSGIDEDKGTVEWKSDNKEVNLDWYETKQDYWLKTFSRPSFLDIGLSVDTEKVDMVFLLDITQDSFTLFKDSGDVKTNIPFLGAIIDLNFPRVGYVDYTSEDESIYLSIGRRQIKWGPATYDMAISNSQPYLDNFYAKYSTQITPPQSWYLDYSFIAIAHKYFLTYSDTDAMEGNLENGPKTTFAHKFSFYNDYIRIGAAELNNVYGKVPSLMDATPFGVWHDNYQDDYSNVMLNVSLEAKIKDFRAYGTFTMDDFDLPHETNSNKPEAMGFSFGLEYHIFDTDEEKQEKSRFEYSDYMIEEDTFKEKGFNIGYEFYYASTYMYNRNVEGGKFTSPYQFISLTGAGYCYDENAFFLGFKYGPDTLVHKFTVEYDTALFSSFFNIELIKRGIYSIDSPYGDRSRGDYDNKETMRLNGPITTVLKLEGGFEYYLQKGLVGEIEIGYTRDITHNNGAFKAKIGASMSLMEIDWNNLF